MYVRDKESFTYINKDNENAIPLVQQMTSNNGISAYVDRNKLPNKFKNKIEKAGCITINPDQPLSFYQEKEFIGNSVIILDTSNLSKNSCLWIISQIQRMRKNSTWNNKFPKNEVEKTIIQLPTKNGNIDFEFMEGYISELEAQRISELEAYLKVSGFDDYMLSDLEKEVIENISSINWEEKFVTGENGIFNVKNTKNILSSEITPNSGKIPYLCASSDNNSVSSYISYKESLKDKGNCIFIGGKTFVVSYQDTDFFSNDSHNLALYLKQEDKADKINQLFLSTCIRRSLSHKYSWGDSISNKKIQKDKVMIPIKNNEIDFEYMETLISAIQKLVIKDVVEYKDIKIETTKKVVENNK